MLYVIIKLRAPSLEAGLAWASVREFSASLTARGRLQCGMIRGHSVARGQVPGDNNHNPLLEMVQNISDLFALYRGQMLNLELETRVLIMLINTLTYCDTMVQEVRKVRVSVTRPRRAKNEQILEKKSNQIIYNSSSAQDLCFT